jgi:hypothetical protein
MTVSITITGEDENDFRRKLIRVSLPFLEGYMEANDEPEPAPAPETAEPPLVTQSEATVDAPKRTGRPKGSTNKPKTNGAELQTAAEPSANGELVELMSLSEQIQLITDAAHDQPDKFKPLLAPLRDKLGVQYVSKAVEKDRPVLQAFINEHGLAV